MLTEPREKEPEGTVCKEVRCTSVTARRCLPKQCGLWHEDRMHTTSPQLRLWRGILDLICVFHRPGKEAEFIVRSHISTLRNLRQRSLASAAQYRILIVLCGNRVLATVSRLFWHFGSAERILWCGSSHHRASPPPEVDAPAHILGCISCSCHNAVSFFGCPSFTETYIQKALGVT